MGYEERSAEGNDNYTNNAIPQLFMGTSFDSDRTDAYSSDRERAFHMMVNSQVMWAAGVDVLR
jgi:hypothetical protein